ncbi:hypothetical protein M495_10545 [Serratia liquefaciens ATCC 27592]|uniref:hypothetical protein n=2 Tax=Serratia liquefaciens TaxID=614 RepID=UPI0003584ADD|nr:hypothetical protein [Serratia liquefaciens]AGQ30864.1 hypothetical protein M495_10545 [Serratia liquefaciens ATCC 27592]
MDLTNMMEQIEDKMRIEERLGLLKKYCSYLSDRNKISDVFNGDILPSSLHYFYQKMGEGDKAQEAIEWWCKLPQAEKERYDR